MFLRDICYVQGVQNATSSHRERVIGTGWAQQLAWFGDGQTWAGGFESVVIGGHMRI